MFLTLASACTVAPHPSAPAPDPAEPVEEEVEEAAQASIADWTFAVWMAGDNDLERFVLDDLDELERGMAAAGVGARLNVVVQADRIPGYDDRDGDWVGTRRYLIVADEADGPASPVIEDLGEVDMGDPAALAEFLTWTDERYPADRMAVILWNHGGGFWIASDDTSGTRIQIDEGELGDALAPVVARRGGPVDLVAFDACNMAQWETAHALAPFASAMVASQAWVDWGGFAYDLALPEVAALGAAADPFTVGDLLAHSAVVANGELTQSVIDLGAMGALDEAIDGLAAAWLADPTLTLDFVRSREEARGLDRRWDAFWMDLGGLGDAAARADDPAVAAAGAELRAALDQAVVVSLAAEPLAWASGLTVFTDTSRRGWLDRYREGPWAEATRWDELLDAVSRTGH